ncbi:MAG TPA: XylR N-terminal domain-containing protein, partial [Rhodocyclaceae bacterium]|nr:XylR N-terminal domain-containing protein [Rhodocyclaceae bacterium]
MTSRAKLDLSSLGISLAMPEDLPIPGIADLAKQLHFNPAEGRIWLQDRRMILLHANAFAALRTELIEAYGTESARGLLTRVGYVAGCRDAEMASKVRGAADKPTDILAAGAQLHSLEGIVLVEVLKADVDSTTGHCHMEILWKNSFEEEAHVNAYGLGSEPSCWMAVGHASGFLSTCMGRRILVREVECRSTGAPHCRVIAKPASEWDDAQEDLRYFEPQHIDNTSRQRSEKSGSAV